MKPIKQLLFIAVLGILLSACSLFRNKKSNVKLAATTAASSQTAVKKTADSVKKSKPKTFKELITAKAVTDTGFFNIHKLDEKYYLEIPDAILGRDILVVNRIAKGAADNRPSQGTYGYSGDQLTENLVRFSKGPNNKLFVKTISYRERSADSSLNGMYRTVENSNVQPIAASFDIKAFGQDSTGSVIDITDFISADQALLGFDPVQKKNYGLAGFQKDKSYVLGMQAFARNLELQTVNTYGKGDVTATYELNTSIVLLPEQAMKPRFSDKRIGYFERGYVDFDEPQGVRVKSMITRWKLQPKPADMERYKKGELVEPIKPIVYYIDPATPKKWVPYLIQGVNDWQKAFEKAGFKNAIYALEAPVGNKEWNLYDARHNAIIYKPSVVANASGPHVNDPRSGEILETHINWYHNVMSLLHDWYMVQAGPNDPGARKMVFDDELMGQLIRFVSSHEVGHTLGLTHNFGASSLVPVDSLRSKSYLQQNGFCPSIMDYARFNYVAQPEDGIKRELLFPRIGIYDEWAIEWGYRWLPELDAREKEAIYMDKWITGKLENDKRLWYSQQAGNTYDPRSQTEDLGDNAMKAGTYGISNLKRVMAGLSSWTKTPQGDYEALKRMNEQVVGQYQRYINHALNNLTLLTWTLKTESQKGDVVGYVPKAKKKQAVAFLQKQLFDTPEWLMNKNVFAKVGGSGFGLAVSLQDPVLTRLLDYKTAIAMEFSNSIAPVKERYTFDALLTDLESGICKELKNGMPVSLQRRMLQKVYAEKLIGLYEMKGLTDSRLRFDVVPLAKQHINGLVAGIRRTLPVIKDRETGMHLQELKERFGRALRPGIYSATPGTAASPAPAGFVDACCKDVLKPNFDRNQKAQNCWQDPAFEQWFKEYFETVK